MARTECANCGQRVRGRRLCSECELDRRYGQGLDDESDDEPTTILEYECTSCGHEYESAEQISCPECGARTRRFIGELTGSA